MADLNPEELLTPLGNLNFSVEMKTYYEVAKKLHEILEQTKKQSGPLSRSKKKQLRKAAANLEQLISITIAQQTTNNLDIPALEESLDSEIGNKTTEKLASKLNKYDTNRCLKMSRKAFQKLKNSGAKSELVIEEFDGSKMFFEQGPKEEFPFQLENPEELVFSSDLPQVPKELALSLENQNKLNRVKEIGEKLQLAIWGITASSESQTRKEVAIKYIRNLHSEINQIIKYFRSLNELEIQIKQLDQSLNSGALVEKTIGYRYLHELKTVYKDKQAEINQYIAPLFTKIINSPTFEAIRAVPTEQTTEGTEIIKTDKITKIVDIIAMQKQIDDIYKAFQASASAENFGEYAKNNGVDLEATTTDADVKETGNRYISVLARKK